jgi:hypothetical protein
MQIRLSTLLLATVVVATSVAMAGRPGILIAGFSLLFVFAIRAAVGGRFRGYEILLAGILVVMMLSCLLPPTDRAGQEAPPRSQCANHLKQLSIALNNYREVHGTFPPPYVADKEGKPMHSWRVLILRYLESGFLYDKYRFDEPWDGPNNSRLSEPPPFFRCPSDTSGSRTETSYLMVTGPGTAAEVLCKGSAKDRANSQRILLVEVVRSGIDWKEPKDLSLDEALAGVNPEIGRGISSPHSDKSGIAVALADGSILDLPSDLDSDTLEALLTGDAGAAVDRITKRTMPPQVAYFLRIAAWLVSIVVLLVHGFHIDERDRKRKASADSELAGADHSEPPRSGAI